MKPFTDEVHRMSYSAVSGQLVVVGGNSVQFFTKLNDEPRELIENTMNIPFEIGTPGPVMWSNNSQFVTVGTDGGFVMTFATKVLNVGAACGNLVFHFVSARSVGVRSIRENKLLFTIPIAIDPTFMSAGMGVLAAGNGNKVMYYEYYLPGVSGSADNTTLRGVPALQDAVTGAATGVGGKNNSKQTSMHNATSSAGSVSTSVGDAKNSALIRMIDYPSVITSVKVSSRFAAVLF
uniref:WD repeat-containing protein 19 n=1 Tax=Lygus hesperus TaxID=30085 RepID=A0A0A9YH95_LYGHE